MPATTTSPSWWNGYFESQWRESAWRAQPGRSILDWGCAMCAMGDGVDILSQRFPDARVVDLDFSETAVAKAIERYPQYEFELSNDGSPAASFGAVMTSSCLEHYSEPFALAAEYLRFCRWLYVAMVPFREEHLHESQLVRFELDSFPADIGGFRKLASIYLFCGSPYWPGEQIIVTYGSPEYCDEIGLK